MIDILKYRSNRSQHTCSGRELDWARSILFDDFTSDWCEQFSDTVYAKEGYFPPKDRKTAEKVSFINSLNLKNSDKKSILDIGTGAGQFIKLCNALGHEAVGTEVQKRLDDPVNKIHTHYDLNLFELKVMKNEYITLPKKYDVITAFRTQFNDIRGIEFNSKDWLYWRDNMFDFLNTNGQILLKTNLKFLKPPRIGKLQNEIMKAFGKPILGWNSYTYHFTKS